MSKGDASSEKEVETMEPKNLKKFYQRSNSLCYPCISYAGIHNPFQYSAEECLPLSTRPQMLQPDVEKYQFFTIPLPPRNASSYRDIAQQHGITDPTFHSLADLPTSFEELRQLLKNHEPTVRKRDYRRIYDESTLGSSSSSEMSKFGVDEAFKLRTTASRIPLQRLLGRWSNVFALITQMYTDDLTTYCGGDAAFSVILVETAGFHFRQAQFRRRIEKLKNGQLRDLVLSVNFIILIFITVILLYLFFYRVLYVKSQHLLFKHFEFLINNIVVEHQIQIVLNHLVVCKH